MTQDSHRLSRVLQPVREYTVVIRQNLSDWLTDIGLIINGFALFAFLVAVFKLGPSIVFSKIFTFYRGLTSALFWPFEQLFTIVIPGYVQDAVLFWTVSGAIGARTLLWLHQTMYKYMNEVLTKAKNPNNRRRLEEQLGKSKVQQEINWTQKQKVFFEETTLRRHTLYIGCLITGPLFFLKIWKESPPVPGQTINGRKMIVVQIITLLIIIGVLFALNWITL